MLPCIWNIYTLEPGCDTAHHLQRCKRVVFRTHQNCDLLEFLGFLPIAGALGWLQESTFNKLLGW